MPTKVRFRWEPNLEEILGREAGVHENLAQTAAEALTIARDEAPVSEIDEPHYRDLLRLEVIPTGVRLESLSWKGHWIEWGSIHNRAFAVLRNAARRVARVVEAEKP